MKIEELIYRIQNLYSRGNPSDDSRLSNRLIYNKLIGIRSLLLSQEANKKQKISRWNFQQISCIELIEVPTHDCPCIPPIGCKMLRSRYKLPKPLTGINGHLIESVFTIDKQIKIDEIPFTAYSYQKGNKYTAKKTNFFIHNDYLYLTTPSRIRVVSLIGLFEDPVIASSFSGYCDDKDCKDCHCKDYLQEEFPIEASKIDTLVEMSVTELLQIFGTAHKDNYNDGRELITQ